MQVSEMAGHRTTYRALFLAKQSEMLRGITQAKMEKIIESMPPSGKIRQLFHLHRRVSIIQKLSMMEKVLLASSKLNSNLS